MDNTTSIMNDATLIQAVRNFCTDHGISTSRILAITVQKNRTEVFFSLIVDFDNSKILKNYPSVFPGYKEIKVGDFNICYSADLPQPVLPEHQTITEQQNNKEPFCCGQLEDYRSIQTAHEQLFNDFKAGIGHHPNYAILVERQVNFGPVISKQYFKMLDGNCIPVDGEFKNKVHSHKNYKCKKHNLFFKVDLFNANSGSEGYNYHHMRLNPSTFRNDALFNEFQQTVQQA